MQPSLRRWAAVVCAVVPLAALGGCGGARTTEAPTTATGKTTVSERERSKPVAAPGTTRLGASADDPSAIPFDAAAIARAAYPGDTTAARPQVVVLVDEYDWATALAASTLSGWPLHAPLLYTHAGSMAASSEALRAMRPSGAPALGGAQVISVRYATTPSGYRARSIAPTNDSVNGAVEIERFASALRGRPPSRVLVTNPGADPGMVMPVASLAAQLAAPVLYVESSGVPGPTAAELRRIGRPSIYVVGPSSVVSDRILRQLGRLGHVKRLAGRNPATNAITVARFADASLGFRHGGRRGLVFGSTASHHFSDAPPAAILSTVGLSGPLLLVESPTRLPQALATYMRDLRHPHPSRGNGGAHRHGWVIGGEDAISTSLQDSIGARL